MPVDVEEVKEENESKRKRVLKFLREHKEKGFTEEEIKERTGVPIIDAFSGHFPQFERIETTRHQGEVLYHYKFDWSCVLFFVGIAIGAIGFSLAVFY